MWRNLQRLTDNPDGLLAIPPDLGYAKPRFELHSLREAMLAFSALVRYRGGTPVAPGRSSAGAACWRPCATTCAPMGAGSLPFSLPAYAGAPIPALSTNEVGSDLTRTTGRLLEGLVEFYQATADPLALELAERIARYHLEHTTTEDGAMPTHIVDPEHIGHCHSYLGTLRGLVKYGRLTGRRFYFRRVSPLPITAPCRNGSSPPPASRRTTWASCALPTASATRSPIRPAPGMWRSSRSGWPGRWIRRYWTTCSGSSWRGCLPAQCTPQDAAAHPEANLGPRQLGGWGIHQWPHAGKCCILDVVAAVAHTLCDIYSHIAERDDMGLNVYLHLDYADDRVAITSSATRRRS